MPTHTQWIDCIGQKAVNGVHLTLIAGCCLDGLPAWSTPFVDTPVSTNMPQPLRMHLCRSMMLLKCSSVLKLWHMLKCREDCIQAAWQTVGARRRVRLRSHAGRALPHLKHAVVHQQLYAQRLHSA